MNESMPTPATETATETANASGAGQPRPSVRILVVDDDPQVCQFSARLLARQGYEVNAAADGAAGWEALNAARYDLLITDNDMPKVSGIELIKQVRARRMPLPIIMASGSLPHAEFTRHPWLQPVAILLKPYEVAVFLATVQAVLRVTTSDQEPVGPPLDWQSRPAALDLRL